MQKTSKCGEKLETLNLIKLSFFIYGLGGLLFHSLPNKLENLGLRLQVVKEEKINRREINRREINRREIKKENSNKRSRIQSYKRYKRNKRNLICLVQTMNKLKKHYKNRKSKWLLKLRRKSLLQENQ